MKTLCIVIASLLSFMCMPMEEEITYRCAGLQDLDAILTLMSVVSSTDSQQIVILPSPIRRDAVQKAIEKGRFFVAATPEGTVIAYKKLYLINNQEELREILADEIRCIGKDGQHQNPESKGVLHYRINRKPRVDSSEAEIPAVNATLFIYNGADYTLPHYRQQHINTHLTQYALKTIQAELIKLLKSNRTISSIALVYGLVQALSGNSLEGGRTSSIGFEFSQAMRALSQAYSSQESDTTDEKKNESTATCLNCSRYTAFMPVFNATGALRPDSESIPGFGYVLTFDLRSGDRS